MSNSKKQIMLKNAKTLRNSMTKEEKHLWYDFLKNLPQTVYRQKVINNYIVDFCVLSHRLVIEIDGSQHYEDEHRLKDKQRDENLKSMGFKVLRYTNREINNDFNSVCQNILNYLECCPPSSVSFADSFPTQGGSRIR